MRSRWAWQNQQLTELAVSTTTRDFALLAPATLCLLEEGGELVLCDTAVEVKNGGPHTTLRELERISDLHALLVTNTFPAFFGISRLDLIFPAFHDRR